MRTACRGPLQQDEPLPGAPSSSTRSTVTQEVEHAAHGVVVEPLGRAAEAVARVDAAGVLEGRACPRLDLVIPDDLVGEGVDVAVRFGEVRDPNLIVRQVAAGQRHIVASPAYLLRHGRPTSARELADHVCLLGFAGEHTPQRRWPLRAGGNVEVTGRLAANNLGALVKAARAGLGLALVPDARVASHVRSGELEVVLEEVVEVYTPVSVVYADREFIEPKVRVFVDRAVDFLMRRFSTPPA